MALASLGTLNTAVGALHTALETVLTSVTTGVELQWNEDLNQDSGAQTVKAHGTRRIVGYSPTTGRPEAAGYDVNSKDSIRALFGKGTFTNPLA